MCVWNPQKLEESLRSPGNRVTNGFKPPDRCLGTNLGPLPTGGHNCWVLSWPLIYFLFSVCICVGMYLCKYSLRGCMCVYLWVVYIGGCSSVFWETRGWRWMASGIFLFHFVLLLWGGVSPSLFVLFPPSRLKTGKAQWPSCPYFPQRWFTRQHGTTPG